MVKIYSIAVSGETKINSSYPIWYDWARYVTETAEENQEVDANVIVSQIWIETILTIS